MARRLVILWMGICSALALAAQSDEGGPALRLHNGNFLLRGSFGQVRGILRADEKTQVEQRGVTFTLHHHLVGAGAFISVIVSEGPPKAAQVYFFEVNGEQILLLSGQPISARAETVDAALTKALSDLERHNSWNIALSVRAIVHYFFLHPDREFQDFADAAELGWIRQVARPSGPMARKMGLDEKPELSVVKKPVIAEAPPVVRGLKRVEPPPPSTRPVVESKPLDLRPPAVAPLKPASASAPAPVKAQSEPPPPILVPRAPVQRVTVPAVVVSKPAPPAPARSTSVGGNDPFTRGLRDADADAIQRSRRLYR